jgi:hypothetical protein
METIQNRLRHDAKAPPRGFESASCLIPLTTGVKSPGDLPSEEHGYSGTTYRKWPGGNKCSK